jgi:phage shock protein A
VADWENEIERYKTEIEKYRQDKQNVLPELTKLSTQNSKIKAQRDMLIKVFESEYHLASQYRNRLSVRQMKGILGDGND